MYYIHDWGREDRLKEDEFMIWTHIIAVRQASFTKSSSFPSSQILWILNILRQTNSCDSKITNSFSFIRRCLHFKLTILQFYLFKISINFLFRWCSYWIINYYLLSQEYSLLFVLYNSSRGYACLYTDLLLSECNVRSIAIHKCYFTCSLDNPIFLRE